MAYRVKGRSEVIDLTKDDNTNDPAPRLSLPNPIQQSQSLPAPAQLPTPMSTTTVTRPTLTVPDTYKKPMTAKKTGGNWSRKRPIDINAIKKAEVASRHGTISSPSIGAKSTAPTVGTPIPAPSKQTLGFKTALPPKASTPQAAQNSKTTTFAKGPNGRTSWSALTARYGDLSDDQDVDGIQELPRKRAKVDKGRTTLQALLAEHFNSSDEDEPVQSSKQSSIRPQSPVRSLSPIRPSSSSSAVCWIAEAKKLSTRALELQRSNQEIGQAMIDEHVQNSLRKSPAVSASVSNGTGNSTPTILKETIANRILPVVSNEDCKRDVPLQRARQEAEAKSAKAKLASTRLQEIEYVSKRPIVDSNGSKEKISSADRSRDPPQLAVKNTNTHQGQEEADLLQRIDKNAEVTSTMDAGLKRIWRMSADSIQNFSDLPSIPGLAVLNRPMASRSTSTKKRNPPFTSEEQNKLIRLVEQGLQWSEIATHFKNPLRTQGTLQVHYSTKLKARHQTEYNTSSRGALPNVASPFRSRGRPPSAFKQQINMKEEADHFSRSSMSSIIDYEDAFNEDEIIGRSPEPMPSLHIPPRQQQPISSLDGSKSIKPYTKSHTTSIEMRRLRRQATQIDNKRHTNQALWKDPTKSRNLVPYTAPIPQVFSSTDTRRFKHLAIANSVDLIKPAVLRQAVFRHREWISKPLSIPTTKKLPRADESHRPYLPFGVRHVLQNDLKSGTWDIGTLNKWDNTLLHRDFTNDEVSTLLSRVFPLLQLRFTGTKFDALIKSLKAVPDDQFDNLLKKVKPKRNSLPGRRSRDIYAFLKDVRNGTLNENPSLLCLKGAPIKRTSRLTASLLRSRELGYSGSGSTQQISSNSLRSNIFDTLGPSVSFTGASGDVGHVAWAPDGHTFAAASICLVDEDSMQYNRPNNLLFGDVGAKTLRELPEHHTIRRKANKGVNATQSMHASQDSRLFETVSMADFAPDGNTMFSVGYDRSLRIWDITSGHARSGSCIPHTGKIDLLAINKHTPLDQTILATGSQTFENSIRVFRRTSTDSVTTLNSFSSAKACKWPAKKLYPSSLKWASCHPYNSFLLGGFAASSGNEDADTNGDLCVWDIQNPGVAITFSQATRSVFDATWDPNTLCFAAGCRAGTNTNKGCRSVVKVYQPESFTRFRMQIELECEALDMNDVVWSPFDDMVAAGCTNGKVYVWDLRKPDEYLHILEHGLPLMELGDNTPRQRELLDTGIRFSSWSNSRNRFYSGSSDGVVKVWDLYRAPEDVLIKDVISLNSGVMCGAFSPEFESLLVGEVNGSVNVLQVGNDDRTLRDMDRFHLQSAPEPVRSLVKAHSQEDPDSGLSAARALTTSKQIVLRPMGALPIRQAVQGPMYVQTGLVDSSSGSAFLRAEADRFQHRLTIAVSNNFKRETDLECNLPACQAAAKASIRSEDGDDVPDSGRSADRIPDALRKARDPDKTSGVQLGFGKCMECGRPARAGVRTEGKLFCERCDFSCLRCGNKANVRRSKDRISCKRCGISWNVDVLGYSIADRRNGRGSFVTDSKYKTTKARAIEDAVWDLRDFEDDIDEGLVDLLV